MATATAPQPPRPIDDMIDQYWHKGGVYGLFARAALRTFQFTFAVIVAGLYGPDLYHATTVNAHAQSEWVYAEVVACLAAVTCIVHCFVTVKRVGWSAWDAVLCVLWVAQVGIFGTIYVSSVKPGYDGATQSLTRMRIAVWVNLVNMLLWFVTAILGVAWCIRARRVTRRTNKLYGSKDPIVQRNSDEEHVDKEHVYEEIEDDSMEENHGASINGKNDEKYDEKSNEGVDIEKGTI